MKHPPDSRLTTGVHQLKQADPESERLADFRNSLASMSVDELRQQFVQGLSVSLESLLRAALVLRELEARGEKIEGVSEGLLTILRRIAKGEMLAEVVVRFASAPAVMTRVGKLPVEEQRRLLGDEERLKEILRPQRQESPRVSLGPSDRAVVGNAVGMAKNATARDLAEMINEMVQNHPQADAVWSLLKKPK